MLSWAHDSGPFFPCTASQGYLMKQRRFTARWQSYFFKLEDGFLTPFEKKSLVGTKKHKVNSFCLDGREGGRVDGWAS